MTKHNLYNKNVAFSSIFNIKMAAQKFTNFDVLLNVHSYDSCHNMIQQKFFWMHPGMTAVTIKSNKTDSNEVKDN